MSPDLTRNYPNIIPDNNLRLPDALTIVHGPAPLLARFVLEGDKAARSRGITLRLRHDFEELVYLNRQHVGDGSWFRLVNSFNPEYTDLSPENSYWMSGEDDSGDIVVSWAGRVYYWPDSTLVTEARKMFYGREDERPCVVTAPAAAAITGLVLFAGSSWIRPDLRGRHISQLIPRIGKAYAMARWPLDWVIAYVSRILVDKGVGAGFGYRNFSYSIFYPASPWGDLEVALGYAPAAEVYEDFANFLSSELSSATGANTGELLSSSSLDSIVTKTSSEGVFHGSSNRS